VSEFGSGEAYDGRWDGLYAQAEARAKQVYATARPCSVCGISMLDWPGRHCHTSCDPDLPLAGKRCTCPSGCSGDRWGNGPNPCDPACVPCRRMAGVALSKKKGS